MPWKVLLLMTVSTAAILTAGADGQEMRAGTKEAKSAIPPAAASTPDAPTSLTEEQRADIFMARKEFREAAEIYLGIEPQTAILMNKAGIAHHQMGNLDMAKKLYERAIRMKKDYAEAINNLGAVWYAKKSYRRATKQYEKAIELAPRSASMYSNLGTAWFARKNYAKASDCYATALGLDPDVFEHRSTQGSLLQERSVEERAKFNFYLAKTYARAGQTERALTYMRKALEYGFKERNKFMEDDDFKALHELPDFAILMKMEPRVL